MSQNCSPEVKARAEQCSAWVACTAVSKGLGGISPPHILRNWWKQERIDQGQAPGASTAGAEEITKLRRDNNHKLRRAIETLRKASVFFVAQLDRLTTRYPGLSTRTAGISGPRPSATPWVPRNGVHHLADLTDLEDTTGLHEGGTG